MLSNYFKIALRNLLKHKTYSLINVAGLAVGMSACLMIYLFVGRELSFDRFHLQGDRIYRLNEIQSFAGINPQHVALSMYPMGPTIKDEFVEVEEFVRIASARDLIEYEDRRIIVDQAFWVDSTFFALFDFRLLNGDKGTALAEPNSAVLTEETAARLFTGDEAIGQTIHQGERSFTVTGIIADVPDNSHLQFDALFSFSTQNNEEMMENWGSNWLVTYLRLAPGAQAAKLQGKFRDYQKKYMREGATDYYELYLQPLYDVHLGSNNITHDYRNWQKFDRNYVYVFGLLAVFVLIIAGINFMNLSTARSAARAKEVGIRKSVGAFRMQLVKQFIGESLLLSILSLGLAVLLTEFLLPHIGSLIDRNLSLNFFTDFRLSLGALSTAVIFGILSGIYPALVLSSFQPARVLKGERYDQTGRIPLRHVLVVAQFAIAISLIVSTFLTLKQFNYMRTSNPGFDREQVMLVEMNLTANEKYDVLKSEFRKISGVLDVTASLQRLGNNIHQMGLRAETVDSITAMSPSQLCVDFNFLSFYGIELVEGRDFSREFSTDRKRAYIINETMAEKLGWPSPVGKRMSVSWEDTMGAVIGVVKDFRFNSFHHKVESLVLNVHDWNYHEISVKLGAGDMSAAIANLERLWNELVPDLPFQYTFLDDHFSQLYRTDQQVGQIVAVIAGLAVFIACLGLFGLSSIATTQRTKEIGIRKVLGASIPEVLKLLTKGFAALIVISLLVATPVTYWFMSNWLQSFAYHIDMDYAAFVLAGILALAIALMTVGYHAVQTARANPVNALRYE